MNTRAAEAPLLPREDTPKLLSVLVPLYNEAEFIQTVLERVIQAPLPACLSREIIVVDDASTDGSTELAKETAARYPDLIRLIRCPNNRGKGAVSFRQACVKSDIGAGIRIIGAGRDGFCAWRTW